MKRKVLIVGIIFLTCTFLVNNCFAQGNKDKAVFEDRLYKFITCPVAADFSNSSQCVMLADKLRSFSNEYPDSIYADDAFYLSVILVPSGKNPTDLEQLIKKYPNGKLEDSTVKFIEDRTPNDSLRGLPELYMTYNLTLIFNRGFWSVMENNHSETIKYFSEFIVKVDGKNSRIVGQLKFAYMSLLRSYGKLNRKNDVEKIKNKAILLFPEDKEKINKFCLNLYKSKNK